MWSWLKIALLILLPIWVILTLLESFSATPLSSLSISSQSQDFSAVLSHSLNTIATVRLSWNGIQGNHLLSKKARVSVWYSDSEDVWMYDIPLTPQIFLSGAMELKVSNIRQYQYHFVLHIPVNSTFESRFVSNKIVSNSFYPTQTHIALCSKDSTCIRVHWVDSNAISHIRYGIDPLLRSYSESAALSYTYDRETLIQCAINGTSRAIQHFMDPGMLHFVDLENLVPEMTYYYSVGNADTGFGKIFSFKAPPIPGSSVKSTIVMYADMGTSLCLDSSGGWCAHASNLLVDHLVRENERNPLDLILHSGDLSYAVGHAYRWDMWLNEIEPIASKVPYMISLGNHEYDYYGQQFRSNWTNFYNDSDGECGIPTRSRFLMPWSESSQDKNSIIVDSTKVQSAQWWYSFDYGSFHIVVISMEHDLSSDSTQYLWIENDLAKVNRILTPWVIVTGHRPLYTSSKSLSDKRVALHLQKQLEGILQKYNVDLVLTGHYHQYERTCPVFQNECSTNAPIHAVVGTARIEKENDWPEEIPSWSVSRAAVYGYATITSYNSSSLEFKFVDVEKDNVVDHFWISKLQH